MPISKNQKIKLVKILDILREYSDEEHHLSTNDIIKKLQDFEISAERKAIYEDIKLLNKYGYEILSYKDRSNYYYIVERSFDIPELKILLDAVQAASFVTEKKTKELVDKIAALAGKNRARLLKENIVCFDTTKHSNEKIYYNVDVLDRCILEQNKVSFLYFDYDIKNQRVYRKNKERYIVNPVALVFSQDNYYLVCYNDKYKNLSNYRVDRMDNVVCEGDKIEPADCVKGFNVYKHKKQAFSMFLGELTHVELLVDVSLVDVIIDKFGEKTKMTRVDDKNFSIKVKVQISPTFFGWCFMFGEKMKILSPQNVVDEMQDRARAICQLE